MTAYIETKNLSLAAALLTLGIPFSDETPFIKTKSIKGDQYTFFFQDISACGDYKTNEMIQAWDNPTFHEEYPEHPFSYISSAFKNRERLLDKVNQSIEMVVIEKNGKYAVLSKNASEALKAEIFSKL